MKIFLMKWKFRIKLFGYKLLAKVTLYFWPTLEEYCPEMFLRWQNKKVANYRKFWDEWDLFNGKK